MTLAGGTGNDTLVGGPGNDTYRFDTDNALGSDTIDRVPAAGSTRSTSRPPPPAP